MKNFNSFFNQLTAIGKRLAMVLTMLLIVGIGQVWGAEYTITFKSASSDSSSDLGATPNVSNVVSSGASYVASFSGCSKMYVGKSGIKLGSSSATGTMNFTLATNYQSNIKSIKVVSAKYGSDTGTLTLYSGSTSLKSGISPGTDYTHTFSSPTKVTSLKLATSSKRAYITKIVITTEETATCTTPPTVTAASNSNITSTTATVSCSSGITSLGSAGCSITSYGFVYGTTANPTTSNTKVQVGTTYTYTGTAFTKELTGLTANTTYYVRPYATNGNGTAYGTQTSFKTLELPKYTVTLKDDNSTLTQLSAGESVTLPPRNGCDGYEFVGWTKSWSIAQTTWTTTAPTIIPTGSYTPTANESLYPVYTKTEGGGSEPTAYSAGDVGSFIIASNVGNKWYAIPETPTLSSSSKITGKEITVSQTAGGVNYVSTANAEGYTWTIADATNGQTISDGSKYIYHSNGGSSGTNLAYGTSTSYTWKIEKETQGLTFKGMSGSTTNSRGLLFNGSVFGGYALSNEDQSGYYRIQVLPIGGGSTTYYISVPDCDPCNALQAPNVTATATANSITLSWAAVPGATSYNIYNYTTEETDETINLTYTFNGLDPNTEYEWEVEAVSATCNGKGKKGTTTTQKACEQLGAATNLTVETDFVHTDGQTYVKFSWTPADNTKNYATNQKLCFGKVGEAGTCVDDLAKNLTWKGDLKSKLAPGEYWWSIQALGDGTNYCDGDVVNGANFTIEAPTCTVEWFVNGEEAKGIPTTLVIAGQKVTVLPTTPTSADCDDNKVFVGWTDTEINGTSANAPTNLYKELGDFPAIDANTIYYAVFAEGNGAAIWQKTDIANITPLDEVVVTITRAENTYALTNNNGTSNPPNAIVLLIENDAINLSTMPDEYQWNISKDESSFIFYPKGKTDSWLYCTNTNNGVRVGTNTNKKFTIDAISGYLKNDVTSRYLGVYFNNDGEAQDWRCYTNTTGNIANQTLAFYKNTSSLTNYSTTCVTPVWETGAATIDKNSFTVNCGERSPMTGANGAAKITFPTDKIYDFTSAITIEATSGFLVSTSQSVNANYKSSVSLSPLVGMDYANTFYEKPIYVRAEAPAQSDTDLEGTITIKNSKGETLQTFSVTAYVTCTQYTLTLVDRGVSTEQPAKYYAGETIDEAPADPEGVCTDPIHYVFDGWAAATVAEGSTTYTKVTFPYTVTGNTKFYAVYRYLEGGGNGDYNLVTSALDDWSGDYLIAYSDQIFANGTIGGESGIGAKNNKVDLSSNISNNTIPATVGDQYNVTLEAVTGGYVLKTQDGKYNYHTNNTGNGISASTIGYADDYPITVEFKSQEEINLRLGGSATGSVFRYNAEGFFRFYKNCGQNPVYLYKKADGTTYYTTSPVCGPHLAITEGKDIYVTGGNAGGTRDLVIAQQKVSYKATRLEKDKSTGNLPSIKALPSNIVFDNTKTKAVAVTFDEDSVRTLQSDGTYTITGNITIAYQPVAANVTDDIQVTLNANYNPSADVSQASFTVHARSLPAEFVIVAKSGDKWYALNGDMNTNAANPANGQVTLDNDANPTKATYAPCNTIYTFDGVPNTGDRTYIRFQGTDGAWLWASSGTNVGIQNNVLKTTPEGSNKAYNWKLYTEDNITYRFGNANSSRQLTLSGEKFGMYASGVQDIRILPYEAKCLYNYAPSNLKVTVLKGTYVTLTWDAVPGATKYQYRTDATNWTDAGTEPTATINDLTGATEYTYYIRAYHEDAGVSQECIDYAEITFTTANCDDVPTDITYTADLNSITVSWTAAAPTATIKLYTNADGTGGSSIYPSAKSPYRISGGLDKNTTYYIQILADGTCASPIIPVKTEDVEVDIVEWLTDGIIVDINTDETIGVTLENEVSYGSGLGTEATELFFSKYYEASYNVKLVAIYNGTKNIIDLTDYTIQYGKTSWESNYITLKDFGATKGQIQPGEEIILYSMQDNSEDDDIMDCVHEDFPDGNWVRVTSSNNEGKGTLSFGGDKTIILCKAEYDDETDEYYDNIIDVIGALKDDPNEGILPTNENTEKPSWGDKEGWVCETGLSIADDSQIGISTNRCLLVRNNTVTSGLNAVAQNIEGDFVTLCSEWKGAQVPDSDIDNGVAASCENFAYVGTFDYSDYYTQYVPMGEGTTFDENARNADGTVTIPITDLYKYACSNIRVKLSNSNGDVLIDREYKVPIMITTTQGTDGEAFIALQQNLATKEVDGEGNVINTYPLSLDDVREICKTCDVVVRDNATLTKVTDGTENDHPQVHNVIVYEGASIVIPDGTDHNYTINSLSLRRKGDDVASAQVQGTGKFVLPADAPVTLSMRIDANNWHWFTLPYDCDIADVTWSDGTPAKYNTDWFLMYYDGESRAASTNPYDNHWKVYSGTTIEAGKGYIIGITGDLAHPNYTFELRFPMEQDVLTAEQTNKTVALNAWGVKSDNTPNNKGWNLVGNPYLNYYQPQTAGFAGLSLLKYTGIDPVTGDRLYDDSGTVPFLVTPIDGGWYEYKQDLASDVQMMPFTAYFVQVGDPATHENGQALDASFTPENPAPKSLQARRNASEENNDPAIVAVSLTNAKGESDKTTLLIADRFTNEYEMNADFFKWFGDYYKYYTKPVLYTLGADQGKRAFNALSEELATQPISLGMYAAQAGNYTFSLNLRNELAQVQEVWLYDATQDVYTNLLQDDYTFYTAKTESAGRFFLSVKMAPKVTTDTENLTSGSIWATTHNKTITINGLLSNSNVWVYDATGKLLHTDQTEYFQHCFSVPQTGAYFVRVQNTMQTQTIKVVVE